MQLSNNLSVNSIQMVFSGNREDIAEEDRLYKTDWDSIAGEDWDSIAGEDWE